MASRSYVLIALGALVIGGALSTPVSIQADCGPDIIDTVAGGGIGDGKSATEATVVPSAVAVDVDGTLYVAGGHNRIRKVNPAGVIVTVAGSGPTSPGGGDYAGDGGPATQARLDRPLGVAIGAGGSLYVADTSNHRIRKVDPAGVITTVAGNGEKGYSSDGGPATEASLDSPGAVAVGPDGSLYIADTYNYRIRKVDPTGVITTVTGDGWEDPGPYHWGRFSGDGGPATEASLNLPADVALGRDGSLYIADGANHRIRKVDPAGIIATVAGNGNYGYSGDGGLATEAELYHPSAVALAPDGSLYIADRSNHRIRKVDPAGIITTVASARYPDDVAVGADDSIYIAEGWNHCITKVDRAGIKTTVAGTGSPDYCGEGIPATEASLDRIADVAVGVDGSVYVADTYSHRIRKVDPAGIITTVAGSGPTGMCGGGYSGDGGPASHARMRYPRGVDPSEDGAIYIADSGNRRIRRIDASGVIATVAGTGEHGCSGDGGPARHASLIARDVSVGSDGSLYIASLDRIRRVDAAGIITTVAGGGDPADGLGDGGPATHAKFRSAEGVALSAAGSLYIADRLSHRVRKVDSSGTISTVAGTGPGGEEGGGYSGDGGPAVQARLRYPQRVDMGENGPLYVADSGNCRIRMIDASGIIATVAGTGEYGYSGDGDPASQASLGNPSGVAVGPDGSLYIADTNNHRIRKVTFGACCEPEYEPAAPLTGEVVTFHANASAGGGMVTCQWDFGDGAHAAGCDASHVYPSPGEYLACVTVTNGEGASHTCCTTVTVTCECDVGLVPFWCRIPPGKVGQTRRGRIAARNWRSEPCHAVVRVRNGAGTVVFETTRRLPPLRWTRVRFSHTFTAEEVGSNRWTWEVWPIECDEQTPADNVLERLVRVITPQR